MARRNGKVFITGNSGFPKSLDVSKAIDKAAGAEREKRWKPVTAESSVGTLEPRPWLDEARKNGGCFVDGEQPATEAARQWSGYGSALKPALEPISLARKPLDGTLAANTLKHGCGGINVDGCRVGTEILPAQSRGVSKIGTFEGADGNVTPERAGRWPANLIHDGSDEVVGLFPDSKSTGGQASLGAFRNGDVYGKGRDEREIRDPGYGDTGSAARFFYCAKASDREILAAESHPLFGESYDAVKNTHPTVKPLALMQWLIRLVTPPNGILLEPFAGSGTTLVAAKAEGRRAVGIEISEEYCEIAANRLREG